MRDHATISLPHSSYGNNMEPKSTLNVLHQTESQRTSDSGNSGGKSRSTVTLDSLPRTGALKLSEITVLELESISILKRYHV